MTDWVEYCDNLLRSHGLAKWRTEVSRGRRTIGLCVYDEKTIKLSRYHLETDEPAYIKDTIIHEVAHALTPGARHGARWRRKAIELGGSGQQYAKHSDYPSKWAAMCAKGHETNLFRWNQRTIYTCKCGSMTYIRRSDKTPIRLSPTYVSAFNSLASDRGQPRIDLHGVPQL